MTAILEAPATTVVITEPGVYDISNAAYHADPVPGGSLSSTGARKLLAPSCPAKFRYEQDHPSAPRDEFDIGTAAHTLVLGNGPRLALIDAKDWRTNKAKDEAAAARADGAVPLLPADYAQVHAMAEALRAHPVAAALLAAHTGRPEQSLFWVDDETGVWCRARPDWLPTYLGSRLITPDYKTTRSAHPAEFSRSIASFGYHQQSAWYLDGMAALGLGGRDNAFVFIAQEKTAPYVVSIIAIAEEDIALGRALNRKALAVYRDCVEAGRWPGYTDDIAYVSLPVYASRAGWDEAA